MTANTLAQGNGLVDPLHTIQDADSVTIMFMPLRLIGSVLMFNNFPQREMWRVLMDTVPGIHLDWTTRRALELTIVDLLN